MRKTKKKQQGENKMNNLTKKDFQATLKALLQENIVGVYKDEEEGVFTFLLPGGKEFRVYIEEV